jgi:hypothetical protein
MSTQSSVPRVPLSFSPRLAVEDPLAEYWLRQVTLRLRREVCWLWRERGELAGLTFSAASALPPFVDRLGSVLDLARYDEEKRAFFSDDQTAGYLSDLIAAPPPDERLLAAAPPGGFSWAARELGLTPVDCFVLALALSATTDSAAATVYAAVQNDAQRTQPNPALAQRLWDAPETLLALLDPAHALVRAGLLAPVAGWDHGLAVPPLVARQLLFPSLPLPGAVVPIGRRAQVIARHQLELAVARLQTLQQDGPHIVPVLGAAGADHAGAAGQLADVLAAVAVAPAAGTSAADLPALFTLAWLRQVVLYLPFELLAATAHEHVGPVSLPLPALPVTVVAGLAERGELKRLPASRTLPVLSLQALDFHDRVQCWTEALGPTAAEAQLADAVADCARRFRYEASSIRQIAGALRALPRPLVPADLFTACRAAVDLGELAQRITPRFGAGDLMLPARQTRQVAELIQAVRALTTVHFEWGTARAWNESGLSALFSGAPGTGKTMAAEVIAAAVGMPLFRIDLSQVVNKYIGETEKNLRRLFDAADAADVILFFDEADALFGKRTEVRDSHDRYANLEVSYLLERMERFKGFAILATNRKKDLDEAFLRRLRYLIEFPLPGAAERLRIWRSAIPPGADAADLDFAFLAERFPLTGGHIRAIVFDACLQTAHSGSRRLELAVVLRAVRRELEKLGRAISLEQFAPHAAVLEE